MDSHEELLSGDPPVSTAPKARIPRDPITRLEEVRSHNDDPWVECRSTSRQVATDALGPVISHGFVEAPGYRPGVLDAEQARFVRRAKLRKLPLSEGFVFEDVVLPSAEITATSLKRVIEGAVAIAGWTLPGDLALTQVRDLARAEDRGAQREWWVAVQHDRRLVRGAYCRLRVASEGEAYGALGCWLPTRATTRFEPFLVEGVAAERLAQQAIAFRGGRVLSKSSYEVEGGVGQARTAVILYNGQAEWQVELDGAGQLLSRRRTERGYRFQGLPLDFTEGIQAVDSAIEVAPGQTQYLDSADPIAGEPNCVTPTSDVEAIEGAYKSGMVVCSNGAYSSPQFLPPADTARMTPRGDRDYTNVPNSEDPLAPTELNLLQVPGLALSTPAIPVQNKLADAFENWRGVKADKEQFAAGRWAELQTFHTIGRRTKLYGLFNHLGASATAGPKYRTQIHVHQTGGPLCDGSSTFFPLCATFAGLNEVRLGDLNDPARIPPVDGGNALFELAADGSIVSHEFHHHIQAEIELELKGNLADSPDLRAAAEGMADLFGASAVNRTVTGLLANPSTSDPCAQSTYAQVTRDNLTRAACNTNSYQDPIPLDLDERDPYKEGASVYGAGFSYARRIRDTGLGEVPALSDLYEAELVFLASKSLVCDTGVPCDLRRLLEGLNFALLFTDPVGASQGTVLSPNTSIAHRRRRPLALTSFAAKGMTLSQDNVTVCGPAPCSGPMLGSPLQVALRTLSVSSAFRWQEGEPIPAFDVFSPTGTDFEQTTLQGQPTTLVRLEVAADASFTTTTKTVIPLPVPEPTHNSPRGFFRFVPSAAQWPKLREIAQATPDRRFYYRAQVCLSDDSTQCAYSDQGNASKGTTPFIQFGPGVGDNGCTCRQGSSAPTSHAAWSLLALTALVARRRRRA